MCSYGINRKHELFIFNRKEKPVLDANLLEIIDEDSEEHAEEIYN